MNKLDLLLDLGNLTGKDENIIQKLNPITKILCLIILTWFLFNQDSIIILSFIWVLLLFVGNAAGIKPQKFLHKIRWIVYVTIIYIPLNTLFDAQVIPGDEILFTLYDGLFPVRRLALYYALRTGILVINLFSTSVIFTNSTSSQKLVYSLLGIYIPYRHAFSFMIGLRYIPLIQKESNIIEIAQRLRGSNVKKGTSIKKIFSYISDRINTLLISLLRKVQTTTRTIEARGFGLYRSRTNMVTIPYTLRDFVALICLIGIISGLVILQLPIFGVQLIPSLYSIFKMLLN